MYYGIFQYLSLSSIPLPYVACCNQLMKDIYNKLLLVKERGVEVKLHIYYTYGKDHI